MLQLGHRVGVLAEAARYSCVASLPPSSIIFRAAVRESDWWRAL
ncbi:MAG TPA: hypothetical protein VFW33_23385 [Gemmataceae bacterium]|nr:hypothetical protein [Gemmataceae bacterium]